MPLGKEADLLLLIRAQGTTKHSSTQPMCMHARFRHLHRSSSQGVSLTGLQKAARFNLVQLLYCFT